MAEGPFSLRFTIRCAVVALGLTALWTLAVSGIPALSHHVWASKRVRRVAVGECLSLIDSGQRLDEVRELLDRETSSWGYDPHIRALRGRLEAREKGPREGFQYFVNLLRRTPLREEIDPLGEFARTCALAGRWEDFFALFRILADYGEEDLLLRLLQELKMGGLPVDQALRSPDGLRFVAYAGWEKRPILPAALLDKETDPVFRMWQLERDLRLNGSGAKPAPYEELARERPGDLRAVYLKFNRQEIAIKDPFQRTALPAADYVRLLDPADFFHDGWRMPRGRLWYHKETYEARIEGALAATAWLVAQGTPVLGVYPLVFVELDGELSIHYLPFARAFPEELRRKDGRPFAQVAISLVNDFEESSLGQMRRIALKGIYALESTLQRPQEAPDLSAAAHSALAR